MSIQIPAYLDNVIDSWHAGSPGRSIHLGHWDQPEGCTGADLNAAQLRLDDLLLEMGSLSPGTSVLDVACGLGGLLQRIDQRLTDMNLVGVNIDPRQLEICHRLRSRNGNILRWQEADACRLPFPDAAFDRVFCVEAMFHFSSRRTFLEEVWRILRPSGRLVLTDIRLQNTLSASSLPQFAVDAILNDGYGPWPDPWCSRGTAESLCSELGFSEILTVDATTNTLPTWHTVISAGWTDQRDPGSAVARAALMLCWLHRNGQLVYEYISADKP